MTCWPNTEIPKSQGNAFDWRSNYALTPTKFAADPQHRTLIYSRWCQTEMTIPFATYRKERGDDVKPRRKPTTLVTAYLTQPMPGLSKHAQKALQVPAGRIGVSLPGSADLSRIPDIPKAKRSSK